MANIWIDVDTAVTVPVNVMPLIDDTDFKSREESVTYNQAGMDLVWNSVSTAGVQTQTAVTPTDTGGDYDWVNVGNGMYNIEIPASGGASINNDAEGFGWFSGFATGILPWSGPVVGFRAAGLNNLLIDSAFSTTRGLTGTAVPAVAADGAGGLPISDAGGLDLDTLLGTLTSLAAAPRSANLLDQLKTVIAVIESQRDAHTHQPGTGSILFVDGTNGTTHAGGGDGGVSNPYLSRQDAHDNAGTDYGHDLYILVAGAAASTSVYSEDSTISNGYSLFRGPGRDLSLMPTANNTVAFTVTGDGAELSGFQIDDFNGTGSQVGVQITDADFANVHHVWFNETRGDGVNILRGSNCQIESNHFDGTGVAASGQGIHIVGTAGASSDNSLCNNHLANTGGDSILIEDGTTNDTEIHHNTIHNAGGWGVNVGASSTDAQVHSNILGNNTSGDIQDNGTTTIEKNNVSWLSSTVEGRTLDVTDTGLVSLAATGLDAIVSTATGMVEIAKAIWDRLLTAATHNIPGSAGRRLRDLASQIIGTFDVVSATANTVTLDATASAVDGSYDPSQILITEGTGSGQVRGILEYFGGAGNGNAAKTAILDRDWKVVPDGTSTVVVIAQDGRMSTNEGQVRAGSTTTATLNALSPAADISGQTLQFLSGTGQDQSALIVSYSDPVATFKALDVAVDDTTGYQLLPTGMVSLEAINNDLQSAIDLKDFADAGYDPGTNKVQGVVLVDTATTVTVLRDEVERLHGISRWPIYGDDKLFAAGAGDNGRSRGPCIVWDGTSSWVLYYVALDSGKNIIRRRTSTDGKTSWSAGTTVLEGSVGGWDSVGGVWAPRVWREGAGDWRMLYTSKQADTIIATGYATSADGITWVKEATNPVLIPTLTWERDSVEVTGVIKIASTYYAWYTTLITGSHEPASDRKIGYATSTDLITWTKGGDPVFGDTDNLSHRQPYYGYYSPSPFRNGSGYYYLAVGVYGANNDYTRFELWESYEPTFDPDIRRRVATFQSVSNDGTSYPKRDVDIITFATDDIGRDTFVETSGEIRCYFGANHNGVWSTGLCTKPTMEDALRWVPAIQDPVLDALPHTRWSIAAEAAEADVLTQVNAALDTAIAELGVAQPAITPTLRTAVMLMYMALRNDLDVNTSDDPDKLKIKNDAGTVIAQKTLTDDGDDYNEAKMVSG